MSAHLCSSLHLSLHDVVWPIALFICSQLNVNKFLGTESLLALCITQRILSAYRYCSTDHSKRSLLLNG